MRSTSQVAAPSALQRELAERISKEIRDGSLTLGAHLTEESFGLRYGVSRTPVRAALKLLAERGMIEYRANAGYFVAKGGTEIAIDDLNDGAVTVDELYKTIVVDRIREALPDSITEKELLSRYPSPRSLMTKTLMRMASEGLIVKRSGHGWQFLPSLGTSQARADSYRFRMLLECGSFLEPTYKVDHTQLQRVKAAHQRMLDALDVVPTSGEFFALNAEFHEMIARFSGNRYILQAMQQQNNLRRLDETAAFYRTVRVQGSCTEHLEIINAIEQDDRELASALMRHHLKIATPKPSKSS
ncbi:GntR family transcriptional regulator [Undibacterium sp.]|jgi:DNA-binding GntR family transcriptional regulator|uniref:GntR family transcriptional regulator n=1 Tax=Undibacterium sp. TaxID=1914977 RepID=UPI002D192043|nr:GntR family transcriptional regulator [Undibacterium sp.]HTD03730.1 GntR family transcriptional regulator [Undibacterium sp.]